MNRPWILIVEDDLEWVELMLGEIKRVFPGLATVALHTEHEFRAMLPKLADNPPFAFVIDVRLPWTEPAPQIPLAPPEVKAQTFTRAGIRCQELLDQNPATDTIPVIFYTVVEEQDVLREAGWPEFPLHVSYVRKDSNFGPLISTLRPIVAKALPRTSQRPGPVSGPRAFLFGPCLF
jgi:CheY-like chemotaxis protein